MTTKRATATATATADVKIHTRALMVWLTIKTWSARKYDRKISSEVQQRYNASSDAGRYNKFLLPGDCAAYKDLISLAGSIRQQHYVHTLTWSDEGWRILPTANFQQYADWIREQQREYRKAFEAFIADYPMMRTRAASLLNGMYKDEDYPTVADMRGRFDLRVEYAPLPAAGDVRVDLAADQIAAIESSISDRINTAIETAMHDAWSRLYDVVARIRERLSDPDAIFRDSLISNAQEVCDVLQRLNITDDPQLERMRVAARSALTSVDPDTLRDDKAARETVATAAADIMRKMSAFYTPEGK